MIGSRLRFLALAWPLLCSTGFAADTTVRVSIMNLSDALPFFVAMDQGMFEKRGLRIEATAVANQSIVISSLVSKSADVGFSVPPTIIQAKDNGIDTVVVSGATEFPLPKPAYAGILARTGSDVKTAKDLIGKKVGVIGLNSFHHIMARRWLAENKADADKVTFVEVGLPQMADLMRSKQIDAVVTVDPFYNQMIGQNVGYSFGDYLETVPNGTPVDFYVSTKDWAERNLETVRKFREAIADGIGFIKANEASARESLAKWTKLPPAVIAATRMPNFTTPVEAPTMDWWVAQMKQQGLVSGNLQGQSFIVK